jgi:hypothetical protein
MAQILSPQQVVWVVDMDFALVLMEMAEQVEEVRRVEQELPQLVQATAAQILLVPVVVVELGTVQADLVVPDPQQHYLVYLI